MSALLKPTAEPDAPMSQSDKDDRKALERVVARSINSFLECGSALIEIRDRRFYRDRYPSFEAYLKDRWPDLSRSHAYRFIAAAKTVAALSPPGEPVTVPLPTLEAQTRELVGLEPAEAKAAWSDAVARKGPKASGPDVRESVRRVRPATEVDAARESGVIPAAAEVTVIDPEEDATGPDPDGVKSPDLSDEDWVKTLPAYADLADHVRPKFAADAVLFLHATPARRAFARTFSGLKSKATKACHGHLGRYGSAVTRTLHVSDPSRWLACKPCDGTGQSVLGKCDLCFGHGYHT